MVYLPTFTIIHHKNQLNVGKYTIHGSHGILESVSNLPKLIPSKELRCIFFNKVGPEPIVRNGVMETL